MSKKQKNAKNAKSEKSEKENEKEQEILPSCIYQHFVLVSFSLKNLFFMMTPL